MSEHDWLDTCSGEVPMPEFDWFSPNDCGEKAVWMEEARKVAIAYADARCAKLQAERDSARKYIAEYKRTANQVMDLLSQTIKERDALAERLKAMADDTTVERAAIAISNAIRWHREPATYWKWLSDEERERFMSYARAAIDAIGGNEP